MARFVAQISRCAARSVLSFPHEATFVASAKSFKPANFIRHIATTHRCNAERRYTDKHEWVTVDGKIGTVGISNYAQDALGDVVYAQLPDVGSLVKKDEECGALESVKAASEVMSPCSGKVTEKNEAVESKPALINSSCYDEGWLFKIELSDPAEVNTLMDENAYNEFLKTDPH
ncbi:glycine cleavage system H protein [Phymastichus coffea]|uniref:glycine cleavage system H protein n=1 Tax=Phymastichus coffea TaxID=108790 RepID=UPI00273CF3C6|nr:glycine cleavage system H protein [Phymastichus coffea]